MNTPDWIPEHHAKEALRRAIQNQDSERDFKERHISSDDLDLIAAEVGVGPEVVRAEVSQIWAGSSNPHGEDEWLDRWKAVEYFRILVTSPLELILVVSIFGILATFALKSAGFGSQRMAILELGGNARAFVYQQEVYHSKHGTYAGSVRDLSGFVLENGTEVVISDADAKGYHATVTHPRLSKACTIAVGEEYRMACPGRADLD